MSKTKVRIERINSLTKVSQLVKDRMGTRMPPSPQGTLPFPTFRPAAENSYTPASSDLDLISFRNINPKIIIFTVSFTAEVAKQALPSFVTGKLLTVGNVRSQLLPATPLNAA